QTIGDTLHQYSARVNPKPGKYIKFPEQWLTSLIDLFWRATSMESSIDPEERTITRSLMIHTARIQNPRYSKRREMQ
ncbi:hypothetical protein PFISCL1PPCAC_7187, partial [Pristionchus fissidentatus]